MGGIKATNMQKQTNLTLNLGVIQTLKLNNTLDLNLDIKVNIISDSFDDAKGGTSFEGNELRP